MENKITVFEVTWREAKPAPDHRAWYLGMSVDHSESVVVEYPLETKGVEGLEAPYGSIVTMSLFAVDDNGREEPISTVTFRLDESMEGLSWPAQGLAARAMHQRKPVG